MTALAKPASHSKQSHQDRNECDKTPANMIVRKHVGAIQIFNSLTLLQRKVFAALLLNGYDELPNFSIISHQIPIGVLSYLAGFNSKNTPYLKESLTGLVTSPVQWNILRSDGRAAWAVSATLASARIEDGVVYYSFSPELRKRLYDPEVSGVLSASVTRLMKSSPALALYENCMVYAEGGVTPAFALPDLKGLLGVAGNSTYDDFGKFKDKVLNPACREVNRVAPIQLEPILNRSARKVVSVAFAIKILGDGGLDKMREQADPFHGRDTDLVTRLQEEMTLGYGSVVKLFEQHSDERLRAVRDYVVARFQEGKVQKHKLAPYFLRVAENATPESLSQKQTTLTLEARKPASEKPKDEATLAAESAEAERKLQLQARLHTAEARLDALDSEQRAKLEESFRQQLAADNKLIYDSLRKQEFSGPLYRKLLIQHVAAND
ncbi:RepB family plasmid replication initiator protein [Xanthomonas campestris pv. campestris]|uniref:replication initiation protein n=1 Tax=Xanthomonas campestris TaxID=339 RepID=UPI001C84C0C7|nr:replication initiation protein [Xanthomonas campestris]MCF8870030.1 RepB family plasmid replication initiator protein [Xanthomonas campestris pv. campestris]MEB1704847.1 RepB family plasmid replication initiator protein [Xanthomonas campestris pv. campestris]MEB1724811.1 RepB family plasmid replication initiator protein [Xanthomonas campestris pv. campestris]MEB1896856.1 RepB family plasmid replication initiator protein [Xanthomonas campestris pv. campestris]